MRPNHTETGIGMEVGDMEAASEVRSTEEGI